MNIITHNCLAGYLYKNCIKSEFENPFIWTVIDFNSMLKLILNWDNINFNNYELIKDNNWNFSIIIDNNIKIQYVHYKFDKNINFIDKNGTGTDIKSNKIWEYIINVYEKRIKRMQIKKEKPIFLICNSKTIFKDCFYTDEQLKILEKYKNVYIFKNLENNETEDNAKIIYNNYKNIFNKKEGN